MTVSSSLTRDWPLAKVVPYLFLLLVLPLALIQTRTTVHWIADEISPPVGMTRAQLRNEASHDFTTFWAAGVLVRRGRPGRDYAPYAPAINQRETGVRTERWYYPPPTLLIMPLATIGGFRSGYLFWTLGLLIAGFALLRWAGVPWVPIMLALASPASLWSFNMGQFGFIDGAAFFAALLMLDRQPSRAGAVIGALILKPQAALISPFLLLARGRYRAFAAASAVAISLVGLTTLLFGWSIWADFLAAGTASQNHVLLASFPGHGQIRGASIFWMLRSFSLPVPVSLAGQAMGAMAAIFWGVKLWRDQNVDPLNRAAITICLTLFLTPYAYTDDLCGYSLAIICLAWRRRQLKLADAILVMWPALCAFVSILFHAELTPVFIAWAAIRAGRTVKP